MKSKKKILIVGGAGYIGRKFCELYSKKYRIYIIDSFWFSKRKVPDVTNVIGDIHSYDAQKIFKQNFNSILILSGLSNDPMANLSPDLNFKHNNYAISNLLFLLSKSKVKKVIFGSSCSVYGDTGGKRVTENDEVKVEYPYGISKFLIDKYIELLNKNHLTTSFYSLRQGTVSGFGPRMRFDLVINKMVKDALLYKQINTIDKNIWRPILDINDACNIYDKIINNNIPRGIYNLYSYNITVDEIAEKIKNYFSKMNISINIKRNLKIKEKRNYKVSRVKINRYFKYKYRNVDQTIDDIYQNIYKFKDLDSDKYLNVTYFKKKFKV